MCEASEGWTTNKAIAWLVEAGTARDYPGLYRAAGEFKKPTAAELAAVKSFPEVSQPSTLVDAMVKIDEHFSNLKLTQKAGWKTPPGHADISPAHEATMLWEQFKELARQPDTARRPDDYHAKLASSEQATAALRLLFKESANVTTLDTTLKGVGQTCAACHKDVTGAHDRVPGGTQRADAAALRESGTTRLPEFMERAFGSVSLNSAQGNAYQPDLQYRGYTASPLLGLPQGVAVYRDGRTSMGSWRDPPDGVTTFEEEWAVAQIPADVVEMRQNLTSVVEGTEANPWRRWWWGAAPSNDDQQVLIHRSGMCLTSEGFMMYFWGKAMSSDALADAMLAARCVRGLHLDMNDRHTAFELYNVQPISQPFADLGRPVDRELEFEMNVPDSQNAYHMRGRKLVRSMTPMRFPRYIQRDPRDFFYLTLRPTLPGPAIALSGAPRAEGEGQFQTSGLPHAGWPHAFARTFLGGEAGQRTWLVRIDPRRAPPAPVAPEGQTRTLAYLRDAATQRGPLSLYATEVLVGNPHGQGDERLQHHRPGALNGFLEGVAGGGDEGDFVGVHRVVLAVEHRHLQIL